MNILESEIEEVVWNAVTTNQHHLLNERGLHMGEDYTYVRQLELAAYGRADLVGFQVGPRSDEFDRRVVHVRIFELKKDQINTGTFYQALRYAKGIEEKFKHEGLPYYLVFGFTLIGKSMDRQTAFPYLADYYLRTEFYTYSVDLEKGIRFHQQWFDKLKEPRFRPGSNDMLPILKVNIRHRHKKKGPSEQFAV